MKKLITAFLISAALVVPVFAQDVTDEPTLEPTPVETVAPTAAPTLEPVPTEVPAPSPVDETKIPDALWTVIIVLVVGVVSVAFVGILAAARGLPEWAKALLLNMVDSGVASLDKYAKGTDTPIDDLGVAELRKLVDQLREELRQTQAQVKAVTATITG